MFTTQFLPVVGGAEIQSDLLGGELVRRGVEVELLTYRLNPAWPQEEVRPNGVRVRRISYLDLNARFPKLRSAGLGMASNLVNSFRMGRVVRENAPRFNVFHGHNASSPIMAVVVRTARRAGLPIVVKAVSTGPGFDLALLEGTRIWGSRFVGMLVRDVDRWIAISGAVAEELSRRKIPGCHIERIPNGVAVSRPPMVLPLRATRFLHVGRLSSTAPRDIEGLVEAFAKTRQKSLDLQLALVGGGPLLERTRGLAEASSCADAVRIEGQQPPDAWYAWAHCLIQPSFFEGMSNALLEGLAAGLACIAYDIPPNREVLDGGSSGILVPVGDRVRLAEEISRLATEPERCRAYGQRARNRAEDTYDIRRTAGEVHAVYESVRR